jgi:hypothetical protein
MCHLLRYVLILSLLMLSGCAVTGISDSNGINTGPLIVEWGIGPDDLTDYIDVCYIYLEPNDILNDFSLVPFSDVSIDPNQNGISKTGKIKGGIMQWSGNTCDRYKRISAKDCLAVTTPEFPWTIIPEGCAWISIQTQPKTMLETGSYFVTPKAHVRLPDGTETDLEMLTGGYTYSGNE